MDLILPIIIGLVFGILLGNTIIIICDKINRNK